MPDSELPSRPHPARTPVEVVADWLAFVGPARLVGTAVAVVAVAAGAAWLVRSGAPPVESTLPMVTVPAPTVPTMTGPTVSAGSSSAVPPGSVPPGTTDVAVDVVVHVAGAVRMPGVHIVAGGGRVDDAIRLAGGPDADADLDGLNLAAPLVDGQRIYVPVRGEVDPAQVPSAPPVTAATGTAPAGPVDVNRATVGQLDALPGIGPATAAAIVQDRTDHGPFASVDDLDRVPGIGPSKLEAIRDLVTV